MEAPAKYAIGTRISKKFDGEMYNGTVIEYDHTVGYYKIQYKDRDEEEIDDNNVERYKLENDSTVMPNDPKHTHKDTLQLELTLDIFGLSTTVQISITKDKNLGFEFHKGKMSPTIATCKPQTPAYTIKTWRSRFCHGTIRAVNSEHIFTKEQFQQLIQEVQKGQQTHCDITIAHEEISNLHTAEGIP